MQLNIKCSLWQHVIGPSFLPPPSEICRIEILDFLKSPEIFCGRSRLKVDHIVNHRWCEVLPLKQEREFGALKLNFLDEFIRRLMLLILLRLWHVAMDSTPKTVGHKNISTSSSVENIRNSTTDNPELGNLRGNRPRPADFSTRWLLARYYHPSMNSQISPKCIDANWPRATPVTLSLV
jgi:hypothetical protein